MKRNFVTSAQNQNLSIRSLGLPHDPTNVFFAIFNVCKSINQAKESGARPQRRIRLLQQPSDLSQDLVYRDESINLFEDTPS
jgi:hypothetical protein